MMFKKIFVGILLTIVIAATAAGIYQYTQTASAQTGTIIPEPAATDYGLGQRSGEGYFGGKAGSSETINGQDQVLPQAQTQEHLLPADGDLSSAEVDNLVYMFEEEKLARDVYTALYSRWGLPVFQNIAASEQAHMDAVKTLIDGYGLEVPSSEQVGTFTDPDLQKLYIDLITRSSQSIAEAIKVGGAIEEIDILDLQNSLAETDNAEIQQVFNNLLRGSEQHLSAFANNLMTQTNEVYTPQYMSAEQYQSIVSTANGANGAGGFGQRRGQGNLNGRGRQGGRGAGGNRQ